eukprot:TRINITY_DN22377_c0_g1_i1.p1 TRINITY_DN22377_c0_g1~~TRINITY_DN22377_c0_g1_i1.p1  ORF type:complete len:401 (+),score=64.43 TRINITY_DN22377_c0_g1_i1:143-1204(+)
MAGSSEVAACLAEMRAALVKAEDAAEETLVAERARLKEFAVTEEQSKDAIRRAHQEAAVAREAQDSAENRVERLEEKLGAKRDHVKKLMKQLDELHSKMERKDKETKQLEVAALKLREENRLLHAMLEGDQDRGRTQTPNGKQSDKDRVFAAKEATGARRRSRSGSGKRRASPSRSTSAREGKRKGASSASGSGSCSRSPDRGEQMKRKVRSRSRSIGSHSVSSKPKEKTVNQRCHSRSCSGSASVKGPRQRKDSRGRGCGRAGVRRSRSRRSNSRGRSRSPRGRKGSDGQVPLCIPYVQNVCRRGDKCPDRHPERDDCRQILGSLQRKLCRYGNECRRRDCIFKHPEEERRD